MKICFMYDCHMFARVGDGSAGRDVMEARARELFAEDCFGSLFARDGKGHAIADLNGALLPDGKCGVTDEQIRAFFDRVEEFADWEARG